jgi:hypothetical protein
VLATGQTAILTYTSNRSEMNVKEVFMFMNFMNNQKYKMQYGKLNSERMHRVMRF